MNTQKLNLCSNIVLVLLTSSGLIGCGSGSKSSSGTDLAPPVSRFNVLNTVDSQVGSGSLWGKVANYQFSDQSATSSSGFVFNFGGSWDGACNTNKVYLTNSDNLFSGLASSTSATLRLKILPVQWDTFTGSGFSFSLNTSSRRVSVVINQAQSSIVLKQINSSGGTMVSINDIDFLSKGNTYDFWLQVSESKATLFKNGSVALELNLSSDTLNSNEKGYVSFMAEGRPLTGSQTTCLNGGSTDETKFTRILLREISIASSVISPP